ncbi:MAG TPA: glycosyltransferase family 2 protein [Bacteroidia bacterium]|nr:glycosyltransferase family 2 protein [Bacteroidia bacterium]
MISIVSPVYNAASIIPKLIEALTHELEQITKEYEIILVDDRSPDTSWQVMYNAAQENKNVKCLRLSRNFGQHYAVTAGLSAASGDVIILMDCDLQDDPIYIKVLFNEFQNGSEIVYSQRIERKHKLFKRIGAFTFNILFRIFSDKQYDIQFGSMTLITRKVQKAFLEIRDQDRLYIQILKWLGFKSSYVAIEHKQRFAGKSSYSISKLISMAFQGWTSHSTRLLKLSIYSGIIFSSFAFIGIFLALYQYFLYNIQPGWTSLIILILLSTGMIQLSIGIVGLYIGKVFNQSKNRPLYIIDESINF